MRLRRLRSPGLWLSLLALLAQLLAPLSHASMLGETLGAQREQAAGGLCVTRPSGRIERLEQALPSELRDALKQSRSHGKPACGDCLSSTPPALPVLESAPFALSAESTIATPRPLPAFADSPHCIPPATGPPLLS